MAHYGWTLLVPPPRALTSARQPARLTSWSSSLIRPRDQLAPLQQFVGLAEALESLLDRHVDLVETGTVRNPFILAGIERARELVYAA